MLADNNLASMIKMKFLLNIEGKLPYETIENFQPWELEAHLSLWQQYLQDKEKAMKKG